MIFTGSDSRRAFRSSNRASSMRFGTPDIAMVNLIDQRKWDNDDHDDIDRYSKYYMVN